MFDTMTSTKVVGAGCGALLVFLLGGWAGETLYSVGGGHGEDEQQAYVIDTGAAPAEEAADAVPFADLLAAADPAAGQKVFAKCSACHKVDGGDATGPHLNGVVDRQVASIAGYAYSDAMLTHADKVWNGEELNAFLTSPKGYVPGTKMTFAGLPKDTDRANLVAYLATLP